MCENRKQQIDLSFYLNSEQKAILFSINKRTVAIFLLL